MGDAEKEFFFMMTLTVKLELSMSSGVCNPMVSEVSPQTLWVDAQSRSIALHQFHAFIRQSLMGVAKQNKDRNQRIKHHWNSHNSLIADDLRENDLQQHHQRNQHLNVVDPQGSPVEVITQYQRMRTAASNTHFAQTQSTVDENEEEIFASTRKIDALRRDSNVKKSIVQSFQESESNAGKVTVRTYELL